MPRERPARALLTLALLTSTLLATPLDVATTRASAQPPASSVGDAPDALAGVHDVPIAVLRPELSGTIVGSAGYGLAIDEPWPDTSRHRLQGAIAGSISPLPWLAVGLAVRGHWEEVVRGGQSDTGLSGTPALTLRLTTEPLEGLGLALDTSVWVFGESAPSLALESTSLRARGVVSYRMRLDGDLELALTAAVGGLLDNSRAAAPRSLTDALSAQDRVSLGVSDSSAVLMGGGAALRAGVVELLAEVSYRLLVGDHAPDPGGSPLHFVVGARMRPLGELLELGLYADVLASEVRPSFVAAGGPASPIDPRFTVTLALGLRLGGDAPAPSGASAAPTAEPAALGAVTGALAGVVRDPAGAPAAGVTVEVRPGASGEGERHTATTGADGRWRVPALPVGPARVTVRPEGAEVVEVVVEVVSGAEPPELETALEAALPRGEIRGVVQGADGRPLPGASIRILPIALALTTDADGAFAAEVPPGEYEVEVHAPGHRPQTRRLEVAERGVVLLNAQLLRAR